MINREQFYFDKRDINSMNKYFRCCSLKLNLVFLNQAMLSSDHVNNTLFSLFNNSVFAKICLTLFLLYYVALKRVQASSALQFE